MYEVYCAQCNGPHCDGNHGEGSSTSLRANAKSTGKEKSSLGKSLNSSDMINIQKKSSFDKESEAQKQDEERMTSHPAFVPGKMVWVQTGSGGQGGMTGALAVSSWQRATISSRYGNTLTLIPDLGGKRTASGNFGRLSGYKVTGIESCSPANEEILPDLTSLHYVHEPAILFNIKMRALWNMPYTFIGEVLISVNPLKHIIEDNIDYLRDPHPKTVAERALRRLRFGIKERNRRQRESLKKRLAFRGDDSKSNVSGTSSRITGLKSSGRMLAATFKRLTSRPTKKVGNDEDRMDDLRVNQAVIVSGESGSGKTEAARRVLSQLVDGFDVEDEEIGLQERILASEPILESFGNARTNKNANSSRFGKFTKVFYTIDEDDFVELRGAAIVTYLLEQSRVVAHSDGERNFRIFYNMLSTPVFKLQENLGLLATNYTFKYINGRYQREDMDEVQYFELAEAVQSARLGISWNNLLEVAAGILHLGNINLETITTSEGDVAKIVAENRSDLETGNTKEYKALDWAAHLFGIDEPLLEAAILEQTVKVGKEEMIKIRTKDSAVKIIDSIAKRIYSLSFQWVVGKLNKTLIEADFDKEALKSSNFVGILDVFGFEVFEKNSLEQLLINYANEILQIVFTQQVLIAEAELFKTEGIVVDNSLLPRINIAESDGDMRVRLFSTIFKTLDDTMQLPKATDTRFAKELQKTLKSDPLFVLPHRKDMGRKFSIRHFAATVEYTVGEFLAKNNNSLPDISDVFIFSTNPLLAKLEFSSKPEEFANELQREKSIGATAKRGLQIRRGKSGKSTKNTRKKVWAKMPSFKGQKTMKKKVTVVSMFKKQMMNLSTTLKSCGCSYIRCVKPNALMTPPGQKLFRTRSRRTQVHVPENTAELYSFYGFHKAEMVLKSRNFYKTGRHISRSIGNQVDPVEEDGYFNTPYVARQLHFLGVFDAVKVLKAGLPTRINYSTFMESFVGTIPLEISPYLRNMKPENPMRNRNYICALMLAFQIPDYSYRLGLTKVFFRFGQIDNISIILNICARWNAPELGKQESFEDDSVVEDSSDLNEAELTREVILKRFRYYLVKMRWRRALVKVIACSEFKRLMKRSKASRVIQRVVRSHFERKQVMYQAFLAHRAIKLQKVWRGYKGRQAVKKLIEERQELVRLEELKKQKMKEEYLARKAKSVEDFEKAQTRHRQQLTLERKKLERKQARIVKALEDIGQRKREEEERREQEEMEKAAMASKKPKQSKNIRKSARRSQRNGKETAAQVREKLAHMANLESSHKEPKQPKNQTYEKEGNTSRAPFIAEADLKRGVAEIKKIQKKMDELKELEDLVDEVGAKKVKPSRDSRRQSTLRQWKNRGSLTHSQVFTKRMELLRNEIPATESALETLEAKDVRRSDSSVVQVTGESTNGQPDQTDEPYKAEVLKETHDVPDPELDADGNLYGNDEEEADGVGYGTEQFSQKLFRVRYRLLEIKIQQLREKKIKAEANRDVVPISRPNFMSAFQQHAVVRRTRNGKLKKRTSVLADKLGSYESLLDMQINVDDLRRMADDKKGNRKWKSRVKDRVKYKTLEERYPVEKQSKLSDPKVMKKLEIFLKESNHHLTTKLFKCKNGNAKQTFETLSADNAEFTSIPFKKRKATLQRYSVCAGELNIYETKKMKKVVVQKMIIDHKVKITSGDTEEEEAATNDAGVDKFGNKIPLWQQNKRKAKLFLLHVPTGDCVCFEFGSVYARNNWQADLRRAQIGFFGNDILGMTTRTHLLELDKKVKFNSPDLKKFMASLADDAVNTTSNPRFSTTRKGKISDEGQQKDPKATANGSSQVSSWANDFLNIGKKGKIPHVSSTKSGLLSRNSRKGDF